MGVPTHPRRSTALQDKSPGNDSKPVRVGLHGETQEAHSQEGEGVPLQREKVSDFVLLDNLPTLAYAGR